MTIPKRPTRTDASSVYTSRTLDKATVSAFIAGDVAAYRALYEVYADNLFAYCVYILSDVGIAEDAFQEVLIRVYTSRTQLREREPKAVKAWLMKITRSVCLNLTRTSKFLPEFVYLDEDFENDSAEYVSRKELSFEGINTEMPEQIFQHAFASIAPIYREAFMLKEIEGFSYDEIADLTGVSSANVKVRINRAKKMLRKLLAPHFRDEIRVRVPVRESEHEINE